MTSTTLAKQAFEIRAAEKKLSVAILGRADPNASTPFERNRLRVQILASADGISADFATFLWAHELANLHTSLETLSRTLHRDLITFTPYERTVLISVTHRGQGHIEIDVTLEPTMQRPEDTQSLMRFSLQVDQTQLPTLVSELSDLLRVFPVEPM